jgi:Fic family protein
MYYPQYTITNSILKNIGSVEAAKEIISSAPLIPAWEAKFREEAIIRTVHHGTHIEGNELNYSEAAKVLEGQQVLARERDVQEVINYRRVIKMIDELGREIREQIEKKDFRQEFFTKQLLLKIHEETTKRILSPDTSGAFRKTQVVVKNSATGEITFKPPASIEVPFQIQSFLDWLNAPETREIHPVILAGITHFELVRIHPFVDGNGRTGRAFATLILFAEGYDIKKFFSLEEYYDKKPEDYYAALQSVTKKNGNLTEWLEYFIQGLAIELNRIKEKVQKLSIDLKLKEKIGEQIALTERQIKIVEFIENVGFLQNKSFPELFPMVSEDTVLRELKDLVSKNLIKKEGSTKGAKYVLVNR